MQRLSVRLMPEKTEENVKGGPLPGIETSQSCAREDAQMRRAVRARSEIVIENR